MFIPTVLKPKDKIMRVPCWICEGTCYYGFVIKDWGPSPKHCETCQGIGFIHIYTY